MLTSVLVVVLGDLGHSPRMKQHIDELVRHGYEVNCIAYQESSLPDTLVSSCRFHFHALPKFPSIQSRKGLELFPLAIYKLIYQIWSLFYLCLVKIHHRPHFILNQNPPALPALLILSIIAWLYRATWIVDWHNLGYSMMAMSHGPCHPLVRLARSLEYWFGRMADAHICVTKAMKEDLIHHGFDGRNIVVCYDRPGKSFRKLTLEETHKFFTRLLSSNKTLSRFSPCIQNDTVYTPFTKWTESTSPAPVDDFSMVSPGIHSRFPSNSSETGCFSSQLKYGTVKWRSDRPALLISSTSWTVDEDFSILLNAIDTIEDAVLRAKSTNLKLDNFASFAKDFPKVTIMITGKGPMQEVFMRAYSEKKWSKFTIFCVWLDQGDYASLIGSADLGLSFHSSSSGLDFPMKIVDMLGCSLPVLSLDFPWLTMRTV